MELIDYIDADEGRDFAAADRCENCGRGGERLTRVPEFDYMGCDDCMEEALAVIERAGIARHINVRVETFGDVNGDSPCGPLLREITLPRLRRGTWSSCKGGLVALQKDRQRNEDQSTPKESRQPRFVAALSTTGAGRNARRVRREADREVHCGRTLGRAEVDRVVASSGTELQYKEIS